MTETSLDHLFDSLAEPLSVEQRLGVLGGLIDYWHGPLSSGDGIASSELSGMRLPLPLRWWYERGGRRRGILSGQNELLGPSELEFDDEGRMIFYVENQGAYVWSTAPEGDDPPVWGRFYDNTQPHWKSIGEFSDPWTQVEGSLSGFLIQACLFEAIWHGPYGAGRARIERPVLDRITAVVKPLSLGAWRWPVYPTRFYGGRGVLMFTSTDEETLEEPRKWVVHIAAREKRSLQFLNDIVDERWLYVNF